MARLDETDIRRFDGIGTAAHGGRCTFVLACSPLTIAFFSGSFTDAETTGQGGTAPLDGTGTGHCRGIGPSETVCERDGVARIEQAGNGTGGVRAALAP
ncbi:hypothetical protein AX14_011496, partial [Amanita brunnescens Koide BX004]